MVFIEEFYYGSVNSDVKNINDKVVLIEKVDFEDFMLYLSFDDYWIYVFDVDIGKVKWKYGMVDEGGLKCVFNLDGIVVYCGMDDKLFCVFYVVNGFFIWKFFMGGVIMFFI